ncbi:MAG: aminotransferase class I/II-fold pyridoxal phosphate-dependent enzyme, partial [Candidatus Omnitrophota bacterium]
PNNPTGATADLNFSSEVVKFAQKNGIIVISDLAYSEMSYDGYKPVSFLSVKGALDVGIEFHSLSKTYNMTGWRVGWACGNKDLIAALAKVKSNIDSGIFSAIQLAGIEALNTKPEFIGKMCALYQQRRDILVDGLNTLGWDVKKPKATFYIWVKIPGGVKSIDFSRRLLGRADIIATPGIGFGLSGEGYIRFALTVCKDRIEEAIRRLKKHGDFFRR